MPRGEPNAEGFKVYRAARDGWCDGGSKAPHGLSIPWVRRFALGESDGEFRADLKSTSALAGLNLRSARKRQSVTWIRHRKIGVGNPPSRCGRHRKSHEDRTQWRQKPRASSLGLGSRRQSDRAIGAVRAGGLPRRGHPGWLAYFIFADNLNAARRLTCSPTTRLAPV